MYHNFFTRSSKTTMRYHLIPVITGINKKSTNNKCWRGCRKKGTLFHCWWECKLIQPLWRTVWRFLLKLGRRLPYDPAIPLLGIYPEEARIEKDLPGSSVHAVFQARVLEWFAIFFSRGSSGLGEQTQISCIAARRFTLWAPGKPVEKDTVFIAALFATAVFSVLRSLGDPLTFNFSDHSNLHKIISIFDFTDHYFSPKEPMDHKLLKKIKLCFSLEL